jgi:hypothetical protein
VTMRNTDIRELTMENTMSVDLREFETGNAMRCDAMAKSI